MNGDFLDPQRRLIGRSFRIENGRIVFCDADPKSPRVGALVMAMDWSNGKRPSGVVVISHPAWETLPRIVLVAGVPDKLGGLQWRFFCPISRKLVQLVFFDKGSKLFVARGALGRPQRKSDVRLACQYLGQRMELQEKFGDLSEKPSTMTDAGFRILKEAQEHLETLFNLAASGVARPIFEQDGSIDVVAMSAKRCLKPRLNSKLHRTDKRPISRLRETSSKRRAMS